MIVSIIGARPQFVKAAVVSKALQKYGIPEMIIHTGQHYDDKMSQVFWDELDIPEYTVNLGIGSSNQSVQTAGMMEKIDAFISQLEEMPAAVLVYGDTNSTLAGSLVAAKMNLPVIHVEAGLRSFNRAMPEEVNRVVTDHLASILFCSSEQSVEQLKKEGINKFVYCVGDVMMDSIRLFAEKAKEKYNLEKLINLKRGEYSILTIHRPSNTENGSQLEEIMSAIGKINESFIWPVHPRLISRIHSMGLPGNVSVKEPYSYLEMLLLLENCNKVYTDSGGLQKEAYWMKKQCVTLREETEWVETTHNNWNIIAGSNPGLIEHASKEEVLIDTWKPLYGDGYAGDKIAKIISQIYYSK